MVRVIIEINEQKKSGVLMETLVDICKKTATDSEKNAMIAVRLLIEMAMDDVLKKLPGTGKRISKSDADTIKGLDKIDL